MKIALFAVLYFSFFSLASASELKWNCGELQLEFNEVPMQPGREVKMKGCWQEKTYYLISENCKANIMSCLDKGKGRELNHPGGGMGSPFFILCYKNGGKPRFLKIKISEKWENTSTCFFGEEKSFADYDSITHAQKK
jgi:hypothetical protein